jgi:hypothetical protein
MGYFRCGTCGFGRIRGRGDLLDIVGSAIVTHPGQLAKNGPSLQRLRSAAAVFSEMSAKGYFQICPERRVLDSDHGAEIRLMRKYA